MTIREKILLAIIAVLLCGLWVRDNAEAQRPAMLFGVDSSSGAPVPITTDGSNALKILLK